MELTLNIVSYILLGLSVAFFVTTLRKRKVLSNELRAKDEALKEKENEFNDLRMTTAGVTHEINNALTIIMGRTSQMARNAQDPDQEKILTKLYGTAERIAASVAGLRQVIYPVKAEEETVVELSQLTSDVLVLIGQRLRNHGIELKLKGLDHKFVKGKKSQLEQLFMNLLNQSIDRLGNISDKWVQIVATEEEGLLSIYFMDASGEVGDKIFHKQFSDIMEENHGHLTVNQNNLLFELPQRKERFHV